MGQTVLFLTPDNFFPFTKDLQKFYHRKVVIKFKMYYNLFTFIIYFIEEGYDYVISLQKALSPAVDSAGFQLSLCRLARKVLAGRRKNEG